MEWRPKVTTNNAKLEVASVYLEQEFAALSVKSERSMRLQQRKIRQPIFFYHFA